MHHLGIGAAHRSKRILAIADDTTVTIVHLDTGEILATNTIDPDRSYWRNQQQDPADGRALTEKVDTCHDSPVDTMSRLITCGSKGIRTPDPLHAMQVRYQAAPWTRGLRFSRKQLA